MARTSRSRGRARGFNFPGGRGGGAGFIYPAFGFTLSANSITAGSSAGAVISAYTVQPPDAAVTLVDSDGNKIALSGGNVVCGSVQFQNSDAPTQSFTARVSWGGKFQDFVTALAISIAYSSEMSGDGFFNLSSGAGSTIGDLSLFPTPPDGSTVTFEIDTDQTADASAWVIVADTVLRSSGSPETNPGTFVVFVKGLIDGVQVTDDRYNVVGGTAVKLSGSHSLAHDAAANTVVGSLTTDVPGSVVYSIVSQDITNGFKIVGTQLERSTGVLTAGTYHLTMQAQANANYQTAITLTLT